MWHYTKHGFIKKQWRLRTIPWRWIWQEMSKERRKRNDGSICEKKHVFLMFSIASSLTFESDMLPLSVCVPQRRMVRSMTSPISMIWKTWKSEKEDDSCCEEGTTGDDGSPARLTADWMTKKATYVRRWSKRCRVRLRSTREFVASTLFFYLMLMELPYTTQHYTELYYTILHYTRFE